MRQMGNNNNPEIPYIKLKKKEAQGFINFIKNNFKNTQIINQKFKILNKIEYILFPIFQNQVIIDKITKAIEGQIRFELIFKEGIPNENYKFRTLQEALDNNIPDKYLDLIPKSYDIIGHIAIIEFDAFRNGRVITRDELAWYVKRLSISVTDGLMYFIGNRQGYPDTCDRYLAAAGAQPPSLPLGPGKRRAAHAAQRRQGRCQHAACAGATGSGWPRRARRLSTQPAVGRRAAAGRAGHRAGQQTTATAG